MYNKKNSQVPRAIFNYARAQSAVIPIIISFPPTYSRVGVFAYAENFAGIITFIYSR